MTDKSAIHFVITGGTIDSYYDGTKDTVVPYKHSTIPSYLNGIKLYQKLKFTEVCMKDSRALTKTDMNNILKIVEKSPSRKIIITHGTYTMPDTARYLKANLKRNDQAIVFTGSMIPLLGFSPSDAPLNLGYSMAKVQSLPPGIYVCMNGRLFSPDEVIKIVSKGRFASIYG